MTTTVILLAAGMLNTWVAQNGAVPPLGGHVQDSLLSQIHAVYARRPPFGGLFSLQLTDSKDGAEEGIRTPTILRSPAPQAGASAVPPLPRSERYWILTEI